MRIHDVFTCAQMVSKDFVKATFWATFWTQETILVVVSLRRTSSTWARMTMFGTMNSLGKIPQAQVI